MFKLLGENGLTRYVPFAKIDEEKRMVYGVATDETPDVQGHVVDYDATKAAVGDWSEWRNVREMHANKAAGVADEITLDDEKRELSIGVKVVDDGAWKKVVENVYKGFSIGGKALDSILEKAKEGEQQLRRITRYRLNEISLVDRPANPAATFSLVKRADDEEPEPDLGELVKGIVGQALEDAGFAEAGAVEDLCKRLDEALAGLPSTGEGLEKLAGEVAGMADDLKKALDGLAQVADLRKDVAQVVAGVNELDERLAVVEKTPAGVGPVLREIGLGTFNGHDEGVLRKMLAETSDPVEREIISQRLARTQIRAAHQQPRPWGEHGSQESSG